MPQLQLGQKGPKQRLILQTASDICFIWSFGLEDQIKPSSKKNAETVYSVKAGALALVVSIH